MLSLAMSLLLAASPAQAKDLRGRVGVGFENQLSGMPALSAKYAFPTRQAQLNAQAQLVMAMDIDPAAADSYFIGARGLYGFLAEDNMSLMAGAGLGYMRQDQLGTLRLEPLMAAEFFVFGLENLGFTLQWGLQFDLGSSGAAVRSFGSGAALGAHYWF